MENTGMEYTEKEKVKIGIATCCAFAYLEDALNLLQLFWENYCESLENPLAHEAEHRPEMIRSQISAIQLFVHSAIDELKPFNE